MTLTVLILAVCRTLACVADANYCRLNFCLQRRLAECLSHINSVTWPCSPWVLAAQWIECLPCWGSDFLFVTRLCHVDKFTFHTEMFISVQKTVKCWHVKAQRCWFHLKKHSLIDNLEYTFSPKKQLNVDFTRMHDYRDMLNWPMTERNVDFHEAPEVRVLSPAPISSKHYKSCWFEIKLLL